MSSFALFLPRVELHHLDYDRTEHTDYLTQAFWNAGYGAVSRIYPLLKTDAKTDGKYYSAIVYFDRWFCSDAVYHFLLNLETTKMGNKFIHCPTTGKYWYVQKHVDDRAARVAAAAARQTEDERAYKEETRIRIQKENAIKRLKWVQQKRVEEAAYEKMMGLV
jgi:hypothetical protein